MIPDPALREDALDTLKLKGRHSEGAATFALLAPRAHRGAAIRALVAYQAMYDYLDTTSERPADDIAANTRMLHKALDAALDPAAPEENYYRLHRHRDDAGYLDAHVASCRQALASLPSYSLAMEGARRCSMRLADCQGRNHLSSFGPALATEEIWAGIDERGLGWWEAAAASVTSLPVLALIGAAGDPGLSAPDAADIEAAYFPWLASLHTLLDSLVDCEEDQESGHISLFDFYPSRPEAAERLRIITSNSVGAASGLRQGATHSLILTGMVGYYLASPNVWEDDRREVAEGIVDALQEFSGPVLAIHRIRQGRPMAVVQALRG